MTRDRPVDGPAERDAFGGPVAPDGDPRTGVGHHGNVRGGWPLHDRTVHTRNLFKFQRRHHGEVAGGGRTVVALRRGVLFGQLLLGHGPLVEHSRPFSQGDLLGEDFRIHGFRVCRRDVFHLGDLVLGLFGEERTRFKGLLHVMPSGSPSLAGVAGSGPGRLAGLELVPGVDLLPGLDEPSVPDEAAGGFPAEAPPSAGGTMGIAEVTACSLSCISLSCRRVGGPPPESCSSFSASSLMVRRAARSRARIWDERSAAEPLAGVSTGPGAARRTRPRAFDCPPSPAGREESVFPGPAGVDVTGVAEAGRFETGWFGAGALGAADFDAGVTSPAP